MTPDEAVAAFSDASGGIARLVYRGTTLATAAVPVAGDPMASLEVAGSADRLTIRIVRWGDDYRSHTVAEITVSMAAAAAGGG